MAECPFIPPYPTPLKTKPGLMKRLWIGWHSWIHSLSESAYSMKMGGTRLARVMIYIVNEMPLVTRVLDDEKREFPKHWLLNDLLEPILGKGLFIANGEEWENQRQMVTPAFIHTNLKRVFPKMEQAASAMIARMREQVAQGGGAPVDVDPLMTHVTADIIFRTMFSMELGEAEAQRVYEGFARYQKYAQRSTVLYMNGLPRLGMLRKARGVAKEVQSLFAPIVAARMAEREAVEEAPVRKDILATLLEARHPVTGAPFEVKELVDQIALIFLAGHETTATSLGWTLYLLAECPEWQDRVLAEIESVTGGAPLAFEHLKHMESLRNLFKEALRLYPPVAFLPRMATKDMEMRGKQIKAGDMVQVAPWLVHRNSGNWACPHSFDPDRFTTPEGIEAARSAWLPFGRGPRVCIGAGFAQQEAAIILAQIVRNFALACPQGARPELEAKLTLRPKAGFPLLLTPR
jgi:cytochrome P450